MEELELLKQLAHAESQVKGTSLITMYIPAKTNF